MGTKRTIIMVVTSLLAAISLLWLQSKFEHGDERNALGLVQNYRSKSGVSIPDVLSHWHPGKAPQWSSATESSCFQHIRVHAVVVVDPRQEPTIYAFAVDINAPSIHPANEPGKKVLAALNKPLRLATKAAASASAAAGVSARAAAVASGTPSASASASTASPQASAITSATPLGSAP